MPIVLNVKTHCVVCGKSLLESDDVILTLAFIADPEDPLWKYSDAGFHRQCFLECPSRPEIVQRFNETSAVLKPEDGPLLRLSMHDDGTLESVES